MVRLHRLASNHTRIWLSRTRRGRWPGALPDRLWGRAVILRGLRASAGDLLIDELALADPLSDAEVLRRLAGRSRVANAGLIPWLPACRLLIQARYTFIAKRLWRASPAELIRLWHAGGPYRFLTSPIWAARLRTRRLPFGLIDALALACWTPWPLPQSWRHERIRAAAAVVIRESQRTEGLRPLPGSWLTAKIRALLRLPSDAPLDLDPVLLRPLADWDAVSETWWPATLRDLQRRALALLSAGNQLPLPGLAAIPDDPAAPGSDWSTARYACLTGGPGTGKTTLVRRLAMEAEARGETVILCATTGKAAAALGPSAQTVHRLLRAGPWGWGISDLRADWVVVDEASMLTWDMLHALVTAVRGRILFVGDPAQLPPVSGERVFDELLARLPTWTLTTPWRFRGPTVRQTDERPVKADRQALDAVVPQVTTLVHRTSAQLLCALKRLVLEHWPRHTIQVLAPIWRTPLGVTQLNRVLQAWLNPNAPALCRVPASGTLRVGDRVIMTRNRPGPAPLYNGQTGWIVAGTEEPGQALVKLDQGELVMAPIDSLDLAYCLTIHKAQGSQWEIVCVVWPHRRSSSTWDLEALRRVGTTRARQRTFWLTLMSAHEQIFERDHLSRTDGAGSLAG